MKATSLIRSESDSSLMLYLGQHWGQAPGIGTAREHCDQAPGKTVAKYLNNALQN